MVDKYLDKETLLGQVGGGGGFETPSPNMQCHPIGVIPKKDPGKWHTILHLSYPGENSINFHIPKDEYSLHYVTVDKAIGIIKQLSPGAWISKVDIEETFQIIPVHPDEWHLLGMYCEGQYYYHKRLSMGIALAHTSLTSYQLLCMEWICRNKYLIQFLLHLLDDFLAAENLSSTPRALQLIITLFKYMGSPCTPQSCWSHPSSGISGHNLRYSGYGGKIVTRKAAEVKQEGAFKSNWIPYLCSKSGSPRADLPFPHD